MRNHLFEACVFLLLFSVNPRQIYGQQTEMDVNIQAEYNRAVQLFNRKAYAAAQKSFIKVSESMSRNTGIKANSDYYDAMCAIRLNQTHADEKVITFISNHPNSNKKNKACFNVGNYYFANKKAAYALKWYTKVRSESLSPVNKKELNFKMGYAFLETSNLDLAKKKFVTLVNDPKYGNDARYYFGYISYKQEDYEIAEKTLEEIANEASYKNEVTYYLLDISFKAGRFRRCIEVGLKLLEEANPKQKSEISKIIGESYFNLGRYKESIPFLKVYKGKRGKWNNTDYYQLGYAYFKQNDFEKAINNFNKIIDQKNNVSQNAYYNLGECYIYLKKKSEALHAFKSASEMNFDLEVKEDASLNYAKLSYEEGNSYKSIAQILQDFLRTYPKSPSYEEINGLVVSSYLYQQDYQGALNYLRSRKSKQNQYLSFEVSYYRAIQLFNLNKLNEALPYFQSAKQSVDPVIKANSMYWSAETNYRMGNYQKSLDEFADFKKIAPKESEEYSSVDYNIAYCYFKLKEYTFAKNFFKDFINTKNEDKTMNDDATIRIGDCFFAIKEYRESINAYKNVLNYYGVGADYAQYQIAMCYGFLKENDKKIIQLEGLLTNFEMSTYKDDALFQLGNTYSVESDPKNAHRSYKKLFESFPKSSYTARALLRDGLLFYNENEYNKALKNYKTIVANYPSSTEANEAVANAKNIYIDLGTIEEYSRWVKGIRFINLTDAEIDHATYQAAETKFLANKPLEAIEGFKKYIKAFPEGLHALQANFYLAQLLQEKNLQEEAVSNYQYIIDKPQSEFSEEALNKLSQILLEKKDWSRAIPLLERLEEEANLPLNIVYATSNLMKGYYQSQEFTQAVKYAEKIMLQDKIQERVKNDAKIIIARIAFQTGDYLKAEEFYGEVEKNAIGELKAESLYFSAYFANEKKRFKSSNKIIQQITSDFSAYKYWGAKSLVIMAKNYYALEDSDPYQATFILENIIKNFGQFSDIIDEAKDELKKIKLNEAKTNNSVVSPKN